VKNVINLIGQKFGKLTVIEFVRTEKGVGAWWRCLCDCGNEKIVRAGSLKSEATKSCGCLTKERQHAKVIDISGRKYGKLYVVDMVLPSRDGHHAYWNCICDCGNKTIVSSYSLRTAHIKSCGCSKKDAGFVRRLDLIGQTFSELTVVDFVEMRKEKSYWNCICSCGKKIIVSGAALKSGNTKSCGCINLNPDAAFNLAIDGYKRGAENRGISFEITKDEFREITQKDCFYCGESPKRIRKGALGDYVYNGIDRVDSSKGYVIENVVPCCGNCNFAKKLNTVSEFVSWVEKAYNHMVFKGLISKK